jgi:hypothetical protein
VYGLVCDDCEASEDVCLPIDAPDKLAYTRRHLRDDRALMTGSPREDQRRATSMTVIRKGVLARGC